MGPLNILLIDDDKEVGKFMQFRLSKEAPHLSVTTVESGQECMKYLETHAVDCILSDYQMPDMTGMELLLALRGRGNDVPFIFVTGQGSETVAREAFKNGADDYFTKDFGFAYFAKIKNSIEQSVRRRRSELHKKNLDKARRHAEEKMGQALVDMEEMFISVVASMASAIDAKSPWTKGHSERVTCYAVQAAAKLGLGREDIEKLKIAALLHDVGKIGIYDAVLDKPSRLSMEEFEMVKKHPQTSFHILTAIKQLKDILPVVLHHHERWDGMGYPGGLKGEEIPVLARILCVADSFDSMTSDRPYRPPAETAHAVEELKRFSGSQFDPRVVDAFLEALGEIKEGVCS